MNMKLLVVALIVIISLLEYRFWIGSDNILQVVALKQKILVQEKELNNLKNINQHLSLKINNMKKYPGVIEEQARYELGMVKRGEKYYQVIEPLE